MDRSAAYAARYVAKNIVAAGLADRAEVQVAYAIGVARPLSLLIETFGTEKISRKAIAELVQENFDLRPGAILRDLELRRPVYQPTAAYGHFGRTGDAFTWERTDKADQLRTQAGLTSPLARSAPGTRYERESAGRRSRGDAIQPGRAIARPGMFCCASVQRVTVKIVDNLQLCDTNVCGLPQ